MAKPRLIAVCGVAFTLSLFISLAFHRHHSGTLSQFSSIVPSLPRSHQEPLVEDIPEQRKGPRYAFATFLTGPTAVERAYVESLLEEPNDLSLASNAAAAAAEELTIQNPMADLGFDAANYDDAEDTEGSDYYLSTRVLLYSLLHSPRSASHRNHTIPVLVLHTPNVPPWQLDRLEKDGAQLVQVEPIANQWILDGLGDKRWAAVLAKLRLWELESFDKVCFVDADTLVWKTLDGVFEDPNTEPSETLRSRDDDHKGWKVKVEKKSPEKVEKTEEKRAENESEEDKKENDDHGESGEDEKVNTDNKASRKDVFTLPATYMFTAGAETW